MTPDQLDFRRVLGHFATGVTILSVGGDLCHGMTANAFTSVSLDPPLVLACVAVSSRINHGIADTGRFGVSILAADQQHAAHFFAHGEREVGAAQFDDFGWHAGPRTGAPLIDGALAWLECEVEATYPGGDHVILLGRVLDCSQGEGTDPLAFWCGRFTQLRPGHLVTPERRAPVR